MASGRSRLRAHHKLCPAEVVETRASGKSSLDKNLWVPSGDGVIALGTGAS